MPGRSKRQDWMARGVSEGAVEAVVLSPLEPGGEEEPPKDAGGEEMWF